MWAKLDDALLDHDKIVAAAARFGRDGMAKALGYYAMGLLYASKHLTNGFLSRRVIERMRYVDHPLAAARVMVDSKLWERRSKGFQIHDYHDHNPRAFAIKQHRDRISRLRAKAGAKGARVRWEKERNARNGKGNGKA